MTKLGENGIAQIKWDVDGLVPAIIQDAASKEVLMMAYMNRESLNLSLETGQSWFWSRSRGELWNKGATSGHTQAIRSIRYDCDGDTLLVQVVPKGPSCHTGTYSCFQSGHEIVQQSDSPAGTSPVPDADADRFAILSELEATIAAREAERPEGAYTTYLFEQGLDKILKKVGEETAEVIIAAKNKDNDELRYEVSDLIFHLMVLMRDAKLPLNDVMQELGNRHIEK